MVRLGLISCLGATLALPGCIVTYGLGETADEGSGSGEGSAGETDPDPSATSGQPGTTDPSDTASGEVPGTTDPSETATDGETDTSTDTDTGEATCEPDAEHIRWVFNGESFAPLAGIDASFVAILEGDCTIGEITEMVPEDGDTVWTIPLQCALEGQLDGDAEFTGELSPVIELQGNVFFGEVVQFSGGETHLRLVLDWWGMGWNGWILMQQINTHQDTIDLVNAEYVDPYESTWAEQVGNVLGDPWRTNLSVGVVEDECNGPVGKCGDQPRALSLGIGPDSQLTLHEGQEGTMSNEALLLLYRASVTAARANPMPTCTDTPLGSYSYVTWLQEQ